MFKSSPSFKISQFWLLLEVWHNWLHLDLEKSPHVCSPFELSQVAECHLFPLRSWWTPTIQGLHPLKLFL
jgi:hypothetical protein